MDRRRFVRARIVDDEVDRERGGDGRIDRRQERAKLSGPVPLMELPEDLATLGVQRGEERRRPRAVGATS